MGSGGGGWVAVQVATMALSSGLLHSFHVHNIVLAAALAPHSARGVLELPSGPLALSCLWSTKLDPTNDLWLWPEEYSFLQDVSVTGKHHHFSYYHPYVFIKDMIYSFPQEQLLIQGIGDTLKAKYNCTM